MDYRSILKGVMQERQELRNLRKALEGGGEKVKASSLLYEVQSLTSLVYRISWHIALKEGISALEIREQIEKELSNS